MTVVKLAAPPDYPVQSPPRDRSMSRLRTIKHPSPLWLTQKVDWLAEDMGDRGDDFRRPPPSIESNATVAS
jgi:hypothetical protein